MQRKNVIQGLTGQRQNLIDQYGIASLSLFGSFTRGDIHSGSDVDILVEFIQPVGLFMFIELQHHLEARLGRKVDLCTRRSLKSRMIEQVLVEAIRVA